MKNTYKTQFIDNALESGALKFGQFRLKSGRVSPHFFNAGEFFQGKALAALGRCYAAAIIESGVEFDVLFGPAYKGITLVAATAVALAEHHNMDVKYCFNRKEAKNDVLLLILLIECILIKLYDNSQLLNQTALT